MYRNLTIKQKLIIAFLIISIFPIIALGGFSFIRSYIEMEKTVGKYSLETVKKTMENIDLILKAVEEDSVQIVASTDVQNGIASYKKLSLIEREDLKKKITSIMRNIYNSRQNLVNIELMFRNYNLLIPASLEESLISSEKYKKSDIYIKGMEANGAPVWLNSRVREQSEGKIWSIDNKTVIEFSRCIKNFKNMQPLGVIAVEVKEKSIEQLYSELIEDEMEMAFIINSKGINISHPNKDLIGKNCDYSFLTSIEENKDCGYYPIVIDGKKMLITYATSKVTGWRLIRSIPYSKITVQSRQVGSTMFILAFVFSIFAIIFSIFFSYRISKPINKIVKSMYKIKEGDFSSRVEVKTNDEIGFLADNFNDMSSKIGDLFEKNREEQQMKREAEFKALQAQISPHFLFNVLNSLKFFALSKKENEIVRIADDLIALLKTSFNLAEFISIEEEINLIKNYVSIQEFRLNIHLNLVYDIDEEILKCKILKFLIQPLVENSILHGIDVFAGDGKIEIIVKNKEENIIIKVIDNGKGIRESEITKQKFSGFALSNIDERIRLYFGEEYGYTIESEEGKGVLITMIIPKIY